MDDYAWLEELRRRSLFDPWVKECLAQQERMTPLHPFMSLHAIIRLSKNRCTYIDSAGAAIRPAQQLHHSF